MAKAEEEEWTVQMLQDIISKTGGIRFPANDVDEVFPGLCIGRKTVAEDSEHLQDMQVSHVLCCCTQELNSMALELRLRKMGIRFFGFPGEDFDYYNLKPWFQPSAEFIDKAITDKGKVLVHCLAGRSRSASIAIAYLMLKHHMTVGKAFRLVRKKRTVSPNVGFLKQLCDFNKELLDAGHLQAK